MQRQRSATAAVIAAVAAVVTDCSKDRNIKIRKAHRYGGNDPDDAAIPAD